MLKKNHFLLFPGLILLSACSGSFSRQKYTSFRTGKTDVKQITADKNRTAVSEEKTIYITHTSIPVKEFTTVQQEIFIPDTNKKKEKNISRPKDQINSGNSASGRASNENLARRKGFLSIATGAAAIGVVAAGIVMMSGGGSVFLLFILAGGLLAFAGVRLAVSAKRDLDLMSERSTKNKINRPATIGFIMSLIALCTAAAICFLLLIFLL